MFDESRLKIEAEIATWSIFVINTWKCLPKKHANVHAEIE